MAKELGYTATPRVTLCLVCDNPLPQAEVFTHKHCRVLMSKWDKSEADALDRGYESGGSSPDDD